MKYWSVVFPGLPANAMAIYPFIFFRSKEMVHLQTLIIHEKIHFKQQIEMLILPFYLVYFLHYLYNLIRYQNHDLAYRNICFEREAYQNDQDHQYLRSRKLYAWLNYF